MFQNFVDNIFCWIFSTRHYWPVRTTIDRARKRDGALRGDKSTGIS